MIIGPKGNGDGNISGQWQAERYSPSWEGRFPPDGYPNAGEIDWRGPDDVVLSWRGPWTRYFEVSGAYPNDSAVYYRGRILANIESGWMVTGASIGEWKGRRYLLVMSRRRGPFNRDRLYAHRMPTTGIALDPSHEWEQWWEQYLELQPDERGNTPWFFSPDGRQARHMRARPDTSVLGQQTLARWELVVSEGTASLVVHDNTVITETFTETTFEDFTYWDTAPNGIRHGIADNHRDKLVAGECIIAEDYDASGALMSLVYREETTYASHRVREIVGAQDGITATITNSEDTTQERTWDIRILQTGKVLVSSSPQAEIHNAGSENQADTVSTGSITLSRQWQEDTIHAVWADLRNGTSIVLLESLQHNIAAAGDYSVPPDDLIVLPGTDETIHVFTLHIRWAGGLETREAKRTVSVVNGVGTGRPVSPVPGNLGSSQSASRYVYVPVVEQRGGAQADLTDICMTVRQLNTAGTANEWIVNYLSGGDLDELSGVTGDNPTYDPVYYLARNRSE